MMKHFPIFFIFFFISDCSFAREKVLKTYGPSHPYIQYMGRVDWSNQQAPALWASAAQIQFVFSGTQCSLVIEDQLLYGNKNYIDIIVDGDYRRVQLQKQLDTIVLASGMKGKIHTVIISKSTESIIGFIRIRGLICEGLVKPKLLPKRKIESYGDSITSAMGSDTSEVACHGGQWYDQTNGYFSYASITARALKSQYHLTSVSGIGMIHSCCNMNILMPEVYDKISLRNDSIQWDFSSYQPDLVTICLGQNDGRQDSASFCNAYIDFVKKLRSHYPRSSFILLSSPMADAALRQQMTTYLAGIKNNLHQQNEKKVFTYIFQRSFVGGCDYHPSVLEQKEIAKELTAFTKKLMKWK